MGDVEDCASCGEFDPVTDEWVPTYKGPFADFTCSGCEKSGDGFRAAYSAKLLDMYLLYRAGYPFARDDLDPEDWRLLGMLVFAAERAKMMEQISLYCKSIAEGGK